MIFAKLLKIFTAGLENRLFPTERPSLITASFNKIYCWRCGKGANYALSRYPSRRPPGRCRAGAARRISRARPEPGGLSRRPRSTQPPVPPLPPPPAAAPGRSVGGWVGGRRRPPGAGSRGCRGRGCGGRGCGGGRLGARSSPSSAHSSDLTKVHVLSPTFLSPFPQLCALR